MSQSNRKWQVTCYLPVDTFQIEHMKTTHTTSTNPYLPTTGSISHHHICFQLATVKIRTMMLQIGGDCHFVGLNQLFILKMFQIHLDPQRPSTCGLSVTSWSLSITLTSMTITFQSFRNYLCRLLHTESTQQPVN